MTQMPKIDPEKCNLCGLCVEVCKCGAIIITGHKITVIETEECHWCTICEAICVTGALTCPFEIISEEG